MKIAIVTNQVPFIHGGAEFLADSLRDKLREYGHSVELVKIPFKCDTGQMILEHMLSARLIRLWNADRVIGLKFPANYIAHENKVLWILHQFRQVYDLWETPFQGLPNTPEGLRVRDAIINSDNRYLSEAVRIFTISKVVSRRLREFNHISSDVLYPPLLKPAEYQCGEFGDFVFFPSRLTKGKRQRLAVEAMRYVKTGVRLITAGAPDVREDLESIESDIRTHNLQSRVRVIGHWISQEEKLKLLANALGCVFIPYDEDYGYVTLESFYSKKPVITCEDSGGPLEFVKDGVNGFVVPAEPQALADAMDRLMGDRARARKMGEAGYETMMAMNISWDRVIASLTQ